MQVLKLKTDQPESGTDVTRLWLGPGSARVAVVFGNTIQFNGYGLCWDTVTGRALWEAALQDSDDTYPDPDFDRDLTTVAHTVPPDLDDTDVASEYGVVVRNFVTGGAARIAGGYGYLPALSPDARYVLAVVHSDANRRAVRRWAVPRALPDGRGPLELLDPDSRWRIGLPIPRQLLMQMDTAPRVLAVAPDGKRVALGRADGSVTVWAWGTRRELLSAPALKGTKYVRFAVHRLVFSPDGALLAAVRRHRSRGFQVHVWGHDGAIQKGPKEKANVHGAAFSPDGRTLLTARADGTVGEWDTATWKLRRAFAWKIGKLFSVCFAPDGLTCAAGGEKGQVVIWDVDA